jgi:Protein of unknown function (DUF2946)
MAGWMRIGLRRTIGWIAAYALVLQATLAGAALHPSVSADATSTFDPLAVICVIDGGKAHAGLADQLPGGPGHAGKLHCGLCVVSVSVLAAVIAVAIGQLTPTRSHPAPSAADQVAGLDLSPLPGRPRAPPAIV